MSEQDNRAQNRMRTDDDRVPVSGMRDIMSVAGKDPGYHYHWVVDTDEGGSVIWKYTRGGYEFAPAHGDDGFLVIGQEAVYKSEQKDDTLVRLPSGGGKFSYLMRIKMEWYLADQEEKQKLITEQEHGITKTLTHGDDDSGQYGSVTLKRDG